VSERAASPTPSQPPHTAPASDPPPAASPKPQAAALRGIASSIAAAWKNKDDHLHTAAAALANLSDDQLARVNAAYTEDRAKLIGAVAALRSAEPPAPSELPTALKDTLLGDDNAFILRVYPAAGADPNQSPLAPERLGPFARAVLAAAPTATGPTVQIYESTRLITDAYLRAGLYALAAICLILLLDFGFTRSGVLDTLCALTPVIAGSVLLLALMALLDIDLNFANMIVMPLIAGIGVGCGVHALRRWRIQPDDEPYGLAGGSGRGMTLTTLTTVIGFAAMTIAEHRGIRSLGLVMSAGLTTVWVATILVVPSLLKVRRAMGW
ncbi:MAG TPA: hypothetical protein VG797_00625, partial [Phycisphaerales bacterium]|nr:hypothetical protein [Phycisphaerales bacterium]